MRATIDSQLIKSYAKQGTLLAGKIKKQERKWNEQISPKSAEKILDMYAECSKNLSLAEQYASAAFMLSVNDADIRAQLAHTSQSVREAGSQISFLPIVMRTWKKQSLIKLQKALPKHAAFLSSILRGRKHMLSQKEEQIIQFKDASGSEALSKLYDVASNQLRFPMRENKKTKLLTLAELRPYALSEKRSKRKAAAKSLREVYQKNAVLLGEVYRSVITDWTYETRLRSYKDVLSVRHHANDIDEKTFNALRSVVSKRKQTFQKYVKLKQKALKYKEFTRFDFNAPVKGIPTKISFKQAKASVLEVFSDFAPWMGEHAQFLFDQQAVDVFPRKGKRAGACCYGMAPGVTPFVLLNHNNTFDDVMTMAHEFGHAIHFLLSKDVSTLSFDPPLVIAETASNFGEMLVFDHWYQKAGKQEKIALLCAKLDDLLGSILTQMRYTAFEQQAFSHLTAGGTVEDLDIVWSSLLQQDFPSITFPEKSPVWRAIPHIYHSPFYCYSYAFGALLTLALWQLKDSPKFSDQMQTFLSLGGEKLPRQAVKKFGYDIQSEAFWNKGFDSIDSLVSELRRLLR